MTDGISDAAKTEREIARQECVDSWRAARLLLQSARRLLSGNNQAGIVEVIGVILTRLEDDIKRGSV